MNTTAEETSLDLFGKYPTQIDGEKVVFVSVPLTDNDSWRRFLQAMDLSHPVHVYVIASRKDPAGVRKRKARVGIYPLTRVLVKTLSGKTFVIEQNGVLKGTNT
ncbi:unnamed protein product [Cuscuta europaea]|uniref:Uncharacterized protein n=1 Tax=Cuscuta europaea TaxID=41803 RepID=A0A9P1EEB1_CUSEU|nr:unnamed protein product [Cuscuta europaea]